MGCDIHAHLEIKHNGEWVHYAPLSLDRSYVMFARMCGVRNYNSIVPISEPRGLPDDVTAVTKIDSDHMGVDGHSHSWLSLDELMLLREFLRQRNIRAWDVRYWNNTFLGITVFGWSIGDYASFADYVPRDVEDIRLVFWFDN